MEAVTNGGNLDKLDYQEFNGDRVYNAMFRKELPVRGGSEVIDD